MRRDGTPVDRKAAWRFLIMTSDGGKGYTVPLTVERERHGEVDHHRTSDGIVKHREFTGCTFSTNLDVIREMWDNVPSALG